MEESKVRVWYDKSVDIFYMFFTIGVLNKLLVSQGEKQLEDEDLGTLRQNP
jgi:hypothetical protein